MAFGIKRAPVEQSSVQHGKVTLLSVIRKVSLTVSHHAGRVCWTERGLEIDMDADRLVPLDEAWQRLNALGIGHFAIDELIRRAKANRAAAAARAPLSEDLVDER